MFNRTDKGLWWDVAGRFNSGCTKVSPGCDYCWAESELKIRSKSSNKKIAAQWPGNFQGDVHLLPDNIEKVLKEKTPKAWAIWNDLFHKDVPNEYRDRVLGAFAVAHKQLGIILTKRPDQMAEYCMGVSKLPVESDRDMAIWDAWRAVYGEKLNDTNWPMPNLWFGTTAEDQQRANKRIPHLLQCPAAIRFLSLEPLLGEVDLTDITLRGVSRDALTINDTEDDEALFKKYKKFGLKREQHVGWVIVGAESRGGGIGRQCKIEWVRSVVEQCKAAGVPVFVKQLHIGGKLVKDMREFPDDLRVREVPVFSV